VANLTARIYHRTLGPAALIAVSVTVVAAGLTVEAAPAPGPAAPAARSVSFQRDVKPILAHNCFACHAKGKRSGAFGMDTRALLLKGGEGGPAVHPGKSGESELVRRLLTSDAARAMPPGGKKLTPDEIHTLRAWIDQGAKWDEVSVSTVKGRNLLPRRPPVPAGAGNPIDLLLAPYLKRHAVSPARVDDRTFARRVHLDLVGVSPTPAELERFLADKRPDRRAHLVRSLLADDERYADHWMTFWQDHLRDGIKDIGSTDVFRPITPWLHASLLTNKPYDRMVTELVTADVPPELLDEEQIEKLDRTYQPGPEDASGFLRGLQSGLERPSGDQAWQVQAAQNIGQVFLGVQLKCATCHDSFIDGWTMDETWALANVFAEKPLESVRCALPTGKRPPAKFLYPAVGDVDPAAPRLERQRQLARLLTSPRNGRFSRTIVNRLWARLLGVGLVERTDEMESDAWSPDVLDFLASDLVIKGYDLKRTLELILTSDAYQMPTVDYSRPANEAFVFRGPKLRRLSAEQFVDGVYGLLNRPGRAWKENGSRLMEMLGRPDHRVVVTSRESRASTIQALELLNGGSLFELLYTGTPATKLTADNAAKQLIATKPVTKPNAHLAALAAQPPDRVAHDLCVRALGRAPMAPEERVFREILGERPTAESVGDLVWILVMLPEYQLIR